LCLGGGGVSSPDMDVLRAEIDKIKNFVNTSQDGSAQQLKDVEGKLQRAVIKVLSVFLTTFGNVTTFAIFLIRIASHLNP